MAVTASIGFATTADRPGVGLTELLDAADHALYRAKTTGRDRVEASRTADDRTADDRTIADLNAPNLPDLLT